MPVLATCRESPLPSHPFSFATWHATLPAEEASAAAAWSPADSASLYRVYAWGAPYFTVNSNGNVSVRPHGVSTLPHQEIDLLKAVSRSSAGLGLRLRLPLLLRFPDVLRHRLHSLQASFDAAVKTYGYRSHYQGVYPVKCNQDHHIVDDIVKYGSGFRFGLEAGSKPELLLAMAALCRGSADALLVCNGFKDSEYISLALLAKTLKLKTVIVLEQEEELDLVIQLSRNLNTRPVIGVRAKLRTKHSGHFSSTSGEDGKFGLTTAQILRVVKKLDQNKMLDCLQLLHFHIGSQIPTTSLLAEGVAEAAQIYCELVRLGASMEVFDIGGGLGIDYDGSKSDNSDVSVAYSLQEYASAVVQAVRGVCDRQGVDHPVLCSESGRAIVSHHSVLVFEAFSVDSIDSQPVVSSQELQNFVDALLDEAVAHFRELSAAASRNESDTCLFYAERLKEKCVKEFKQGRLPIEDLSVVDGLCEMVKKATGELEEDPIRTYHVNLSIFTSIPDSWGIGQLFPILPIHRLNEKPTVRGILSDLTCDSDGKIDKFIGGETSLPLHELEGTNGNGKSYYIGMFLGGAYQEALGGLHNLFGRVSVVNVVQCDGPHGFAVTYAAPGASCGDVLRAMQHDPELMFETLKQRIEILSGKDSAALVHDLACSFNKMPYLETSATCCSLKEGNGEKEGYYDYGDEEEEEEEENWDYCMG